MAQVNIGTSATATGTGTSGTVSINLSAGESLQVMVLTNASGITHDDCDYASQSLTQRGTTLNAFTNWRMSTWTIDGVTGSGSRTVTVNFSASTSWRIYAVSLTDTGGTPTYADQQEATGTSTAPTDSITGATNARIVGWTMTNQNGAITAGAGQTQLHEQVDGGIASETSHETGTGTVTHSYTIGSAAWGVQVIRWDEDAGSPIEVTLTPFTVSHDPGTNLATGIDIGTLAMTHDLQTISVSVDNPFEISLDSFTQSTTPQTISLSLPGRRTRSAVPAIIAGAEDG